MQEAKRGASDEACDLIVYCQRSSKACPVIEVTDLGDPEPCFATKGADLGTDLQDPLLIGHAPGHGFIVDISSNQFCLP